MKDGLKATLNNALAGHAYYVVAVGLGLVLLWALRNMVTAVHDVERMAQEQGNVGRRIMRPLIDRVRPRDAIAIRKLRHELMQAGYRDDSALERYTLVRFIGLGSVVPVVLGLLLGGAEPLQFLLFSGVAGYAGFVLPDVWLSRKRSARQARLARALPPMIDMMVLCLEVGLSIEASFERVAMEMRSMEPLMAEEAGLMVTEMGAGLTFPQALKRLAERVGVDDLTVLSRLISQAAQLGASVVKALREYSDASFEKRVLAMEEQAGKLSSQMVMPITICLLPCLLIALVGPAAISLAKAFKHV